MKEIEIKVNECPQDATVMLVTIDGFIDASTASVLDTNLNELLSAGKTRIIIDCENLNFISSAGIGILIKTWEAAGRLGGGLMIIHLPEDIRNIFKDLGFLIIFELFDSIDNALKNFGAVASPAAEPETIIPVAATRFPIIIACAACGKKYKIEKPGTYKCKGCNNMFPVAVADRRAAGRSV